MAKILLRKGLSAIFSYGMKPGRTGVPGLDGAGCIFAVAVLYRHYHPVIVDENLVYEVVQQIISDCRVGVGVLVKGLLDTDAVLDYRPVDFLCVNGFCQRPFAAFQLCEPRRTHRSTVCPSAKKRGFKQFRRDDGRHTVRLDNINRFAKKFKAAPAFSVVAALKCYFGLFRVNYGGNRLA